MGYLSRYVEDTAGDTPQQGRKAADIADARVEAAALWNQIFGTDKERGSLSAVVPPPAAKVPGGAWVQSATQKASQLRLLQALRSKSPGGWSDNRYEQAAHYVGISFVSIFRICRMMSQSEFQVFVDDPYHPEGKRPVTEMDPPHPGFGEIKPYDLVNLLKNPNPQDSFGKMVYRFTLQKYLTGTRLCWMVENMLGSVCELYPIETAIAQPQPVINEEYPDGFYRIQPLYPNGPFSSYPTVNSAVGAVIDAKWMLKDAFPHPFLRYDGYSPLTGMRLHIDEVESMDRARWYDMKRAIKPNAILQMTELEGNVAQLTDEAIERIRAEYEQEFSGTENWGKLIVGSPGFELQLQTDPREIDYYNGWEQLVSFVMGGFGITKEAAGMISDSSYAALFATLKQLHLVTLEPECADIGQDFTRNLAPRFGTGLTVEVRCRRIDDHQLNIDKLGLLGQFKAITKNEMRKYLDFPLTQEPWGNDIAGDPSPAELLMQTQMQAMALPDEVSEQVSGGINPGSLDNVSEGKEVHQSRPEPDGLGNGGLGKEDRKSLRYKINRLAKICSNGGRK